MLRGRVVGRIWATKRLPELPNGAFLEIDLEAGGRLVAFDPLGCGPGEPVLVSTGSVAAAWLGGGRIPVDAVIVGSIDETGAPETAGARRRKGK